ncbi:MAG: choice-of-anchor U domain-containing protein [Halobacteriota archaeon]
MKSDKKMAILVTAIIAVSVFAAIPATQAVKIEYPAPDLKWKNVDSTGAVTDVAIGDLTGNGIADVAFIDSQLPGTVFVVYGNNGTVYWQKDTVAGYSIAVGDIDGDDDGENEVIVGGVNNGNSGITVFESDGTFKFFYPTHSQFVKDIELGKVDGDNVDDIVACNSYVNAFIDAWVYAIDGNGNNITGWPINFPDENIEDIALGNLDGSGGLDVAILSGFGWRVFATLYVYNSTGDQLWVNNSVSGRSVEIGNVDTDPEEEVVIGDWASNHVYVYDGATGAPEYSFYTVHPPTEVELGDLDGDASDLEIAVITGEVLDETIFAIDINATGQVNEMWRYSIDWTPYYYYGEGLAIGDVDRDYKNEVIAASDGFYGYSIYAFDGIDSNDDGLGDVVWRYDGINENINDIEVGDIDGDDDMDVIVGTGGGDSVYALSTQEHTAEVEGETIFFDSDPSNITDVASVEMPPNPPSGYNFPYGVFAINITVPVGGTAIITLTLPDNLPANSVYWKYGPNGSLPPRNPNPHWYQVPLDSNDGDNMITITLQDGGIGDADGAADGVIVDSGGPANPAARVPTLTPIGLIALVGLLSVIVALSIRKRR